MKSLSERQAANDERVASDIRNFGCHVVCVLPGGESEPPFAYSIGIQETAAAAEAIVVGVRPELGHYMISHYYRQVRAGVAYKRGVRYTGFLDGFSIYVEPVNAARVQELMLGCHRYYDGEPFSTVQLVYPSTAGVWPWQASASPQFRATQTMLGRKRPDRP